jgi:flagellar motor switch protein FliM
MAKVLSQEEVNALLNEFPGEEGAAAGEKNDDKRGVVSILNSRRPDRFDGELASALRHLHQRFASHISATLSAYLRSDVDAVLFSLEQDTCAGVISALGDPSYLNLLSMEPLEGSAILEIEPRILFPMIDRLLGGRGEAFPLQRALTAVEQTLGEEVAKRLINDLQTCWRQVIPLNISITATETSPQFPRGAGPGENLIAAVFELTLGDARGFIKLCFPASMLRPIAGRFAPDSHRAREVDGSARDVKKIKAALLAAEMKLEAGIYGGSITLGRLLKLEPGDVIQARSTAGEEIQLCVNGVEKYAARLVEQDGKKAVQVVKIIPREFKDD